MDDRSHKQRLLEAAIRAALPSSDQRATAQWKLGERRWDEKKDVNDALHLCRLEWRCHGQGTSVKRAVAHWQFKGEAVIDDALIHFYGEYLRDIVTGAYREFQLHALM